MRFVSCADKMVVFNAEIGPEIFKKLADFIDIGSGTKVFFFGCTNDLVPMFIRAGEKKRFCLAHGMKPAGNISYNSCEGMPKMGPCIHIVNRRCYIKRLKHFFSC